MVTGSLRIVLIPAHAAPPAALARAVCRSGGGWCCPLSPVAMDAGGVDGPFQAAPGSFADQMDDRSHREAQESTARPHHVQPRGDVDVQALKNWC